MTLATLVRKIRSVALVLRLGGSRLEPRGFVQEAYRLILRREPDEEALTPLLRHLEQGVPRRVVVEVMLLTVFHEALHALRCDMVRQLPAAAVVVDLGGASATAAQGALLEMGYPHAPRELTIVDLPPDTRLGASGFVHLEEETPEWVVVGPTRMRYLHQSMTDLTGIADESADLVWAGQSLEHVTEMEAAQTLREVWRVLKPGGSFCLDTPNRDLTRRQFPHEFIHVEHKAEYTVPQLRELLEQAGFEVVSVQGVGPMPRTARTGIFQPGELRREAPLSERPEEAYLVYAQARRPMTAT